MMWHGRAGTRARVAFGTAWIALGGSCATDAPPSSPSPPAPLLDGVRRLTFAGARAGEGYFSPDDQSLVFQGERDDTNPFYQIHALELRSGEVTRLSNGRGKTTCAWLGPAAAGGQILVYASTHADPEADAKAQAEIQARAHGPERRYQWDYDPQYDIYLQRVGEAGEPQNLTRALGYDAEGSLSPDGQWLVFASNRAAYVEGALSGPDRERLARDPAHFIDLYTMRVDGTALTRLTDSPGYDGGPFFSPDGARVVWRRFSEDGSTAEIWTMSAFGGDAVQVTTLGALSWAPFYHPSGDYLIFSTNRHGFDNFELYAVDAAGAREPVRVTDEEGFDGLPAFSHDGQTLAWTKAPPGERKAQLVLAHWNDLEMRRRLRLPPWPLPPRRVPSAPEPEPAAIARARADLAILTSPASEGRLTGSVGERLASAHVGARFVEMGLRPWTPSSFEHAFSYAAGVTLGPNNRLQAGSDELALDTDWRPLVFSAPGEIPASSVVFAGYGIVAPAHDAQAAYDAYAQLEVRDAWVLVLRYLPEDVSPERRAHLGRYALLRHKAMIARERGARGLIVVSGPRAQVKAELVPLQGDAAAGGSGLAAVSVSNAVAQRWLGARALAEMQARLDREEASPGFALDSVRLSARIDLAQEQRAAHNTVARLPGTRAGEPPVIIGAHLDGLGHGDAGGSLAKDDEQGQVHPGADDNASGVAALLAIAETLRQRVARGELASRRDLVFAAWSGEELGLLGSNAFVRDLSPHSPPNLNGRVAAYLNLDMVGRLREHLVVQGVGSSPAWPFALERLGARHGLSLIAQTDSALPTDSTSFALASVPVLNLFTGAHAEYHSPRDTVDRLDVPGLVRIADTLADLAAELAVRPDTIAFVAGQKPTESRRGFRVYLGSVPDYAAADVRGLKLAGVQKDSPASRADLRAGDVIVEVAGQAITNIYEYSYALETLKVGAPVPFVVQRGRQRVTLSVTPASRD